MRELGMALFTVSTVSSTLGIAAFVIWYRKNRGTPLLEEHAPTADRIIDWSFVSAAACFILGLVFVPFI